MKGVLDQRGTGLRKREAGSRRVNAELVRALTDWLLRCHGGEAR